MKLNISLKWFVSIAFLSIGIVLVIGYTKLSGSYFILGMDNMIASHMEQFARQYQQQPELKKEFYGYLISRDWTQQPGTVQNAFAQAPSESGKLIKQVERATSGGPPKNIVFAMRYDDHGKTVYISRSLPRESITEMVGNNIRESRDTLIAISAISVLSLALVLILLLWLVSRPINALGDWTRSLDTENFKKPAPDFYYPELNRMADLIRSSLSTVHDGLEREQKFLRHTSHELRTPISVIRNNIELINKLQESKSQKNEAKLKEVINRIDRASLTMQHLTETLLWLSKESPEPLPEKEIELDKLLNELVAEMRYLLNDKPVNIDIDTQAFKIKLPDIAAKIVLGNLIRNAFQHTWEGDVVIRQRLGDVEIINVEKSAETKENNLGFGLGLQLTQQLVNQLGWTYKNINQSKGHSVSIAFS
ncbi:MAG: sensor histidine kinase [Methylophilaceae bacterium]